MKSSQHTQPFLKISLRDKFNQNLLCIFGVVFSVLQFVQKKSKTRSIESVVSKLLLLVS